MTIHYLCGYPFCGFVAWSEHHFCHIWATSNYKPLRWRHNESDRVWNPQPHDCLLNRLFRRRSKKTSKLRVTGLCAGNSPKTGEFPAQMASNAENVSIWWRHHAYWISWNRLWNRSLTHFHSILQQCVLQRDICASTESHIGHTGEWISMSQTPILLCISK